MLEPGPDSRARGEVTVEAEEMGPILFLLLVVLLEERRGPCRPGPLECEKKAQVYVTILGK